MKAAHKQHLGGAAVRWIEIPEGGWMVFRDHSFILV